MPVLGADAGARWRAVMWIVLIVGASLGFSWAIACATPFAALAAVACMALGRRAAIAAILLAWMTNQSIGYLALGYPRTWDSFAWGGAIGVAAVAAVVLAAATGPMTASRPIARIVLPFGLAFVGYEALLFAASLVLPSEGNAFAVSIMARILEINAVAYLCLLALQKAAVGIGLLRETTGRRPAAA